MINDPHQGAENDALVRKLRRLRYRSDYPLHLFLSAVRTSGRRRRVVTRRLAEASWAVPEEPTRVICPRCGGQARVGRWHRAPCR